MLYFYEAGYKTTKYATLESLLHAQVATIVDKYDCLSLYKLTRSSFANSVSTIDSEEWAAIASVIYGYTSTEVLAHAELRGFVVTAITGRNSVLKSALRNENVVKLFRSNTDLATDVLLRELNGPMAASERIFFCENCHYAHGGSSYCSHIESCPQCGKTPGTKKSKRYLVKAGLYPAFSCPFCDGIIGN